MKKICFFVLSILIALQTVSCSRPSGDTVTQGGEKPDLSGLSATELYAFGETKANQLTSYRYRVVLTAPDGQEDKVEVARVRVGYESFSYSAVGAAVAISYRDGICFVKNEIGRYTAEMKARQMREYMEEYLPQWFFLPAEEFETVTRQNDTVSYEGASREYLNRYLPLLTCDGEFEPKQLMGKAVFNDEGILTEEEFIITGVYREGDAESEESITVKAVLDACRDSAIAPQAFEDTDSFVSVDEMKTPHLVHEALEKLGETKELKLTMITSDALQMPSARFSLHREIDLSQNDALDGYAAVRSLVRNSQIELQEVREESEFLQYRRVDGTYETKIHDLFTAALKEESSEPMDPLWPRMGAQFLPSVADFASLSLSETASGYQITFSFTPEALQKRIGMTTALFLEEAAATEFDSTSSEGTITIGRTGLIPTAFSYSFKAKNTDSTVSATVSVTMDSFEDVVIPEMQTPSATTGTEEGEHEHD